MEQLGLFSAIALVALAVVIKMNNGRIPNWLTLAGILAGVAMGAVDQQWRLHLIGLGVTACIVLPIYAIGGLGGGGTKLLLAIGALAGPMAGFVCCLSLPLILLGVWVWSRVNETERSCPSSPFVAATFALLVIVDRTGLYELL